ncbi:MAG: hypothetical protein OEY64_01820 [Nitrospinota bacterium]|nr:hypothetical protein [Nitrospinota bacterium]
MVKKLSILGAMVFAVTLAVTAFAAKPAIARVLGGGSAITDTLQIGEITSIGNKQLTIATQFEEKSKTYTLDLLPNCYVMTASRGEFKKFSELKKGDLVAAYGWYKGGKWNAVRIDILDKNDYLVKRLAADAKAKVYYKHENVK